MAKNVSRLFKDVIRNGGPFYCYASVRLSDGTELTLDSENDFCIDGNSYEESGGSGFPLGMALSKTINIGIMNTDDRFSSYDFYMAKITLYTEADLSDGTKERIKEGTFTVTEPTVNGELIEIVAYDDMYKANKEYTPGIQFPSSALTVLQDVCGKCEMNLGSASFLNSNFQVSEMPEGLTCRQVIGFVAMIAAGNAMCDVNNRLIIKTYDFSMFELSEVITGDMIGDTLKDSISGGNFSDALRDYITGGQFGDASNLHILSEFSTDPDICTDDVVITGIRMDVEDEEGNQSYVLYGTDSYALNIDNDLAAGQEREFVQMVGERLVGAVIRPFSGEFFPDPTIEFMDPAYIIDRRDNIYQSIILNHSFEYLGNSTISNEMEGPARNDSSYQSSATEAYRKARAESKRQRTEWEKAMEELMERLDNSSGLYMTVEEQPDGSSVYYMHDKPTLAESMIIWKMTAEAFGVSNDGGKTYTAGLTVDGTLIARIMNTIGINFDWGIGGTLIIQDAFGEEVVYMDADTGTVRMKVEALTIAGKTPEEIAEAQLNRFVDSVYTPEIGNLQAQIDGQIETFYYDYEPTLSNAPASSWTTETERQKHEGDLFYWKSKGYSYRFFKDGSTWKWQMVQDTDITKALATASEAQDTADSKRRVFITTPVPPYDVGDLWTQGTGGDIMRCLVARESGSFSSSDWGKASKYTDDTAVDNLDESLNMYGVFNRLTENGTRKGIYIGSNGELYINATYIKSGTIDANLIGAGVIKSSDEYLIRYGNSDYITCIESKITPSSTSGVLLMGVVSGRAGYNPHLNFTQGSDNTIELICDSASTYSDFEVGGDFYSGKIYGRGASGTELWLYANRNATSYLRVSNGVLLPDTSGSYSIGQSNWPFATVAAREVVNTSRVEQKKDIEQLDHATSIVLGCDVYTYTWNDDVATQVVNSAPQALDESSSETVEDKKSAGFVIGDGYNVDPLLLSNDGGGINLYSAIAVAYKAIQELNARCTELERQIAELKGEG